MSGPLCGSLYESRIPGASAAQLLVLTEDPWNEHVSDSVVVPVFPVENPKTNLYRVEITEGLVADCTRVQSIPHTFFGRRVGTCPEEPWQLARIGVRKHLDVDGRIARRARVSVTTARENWWPRQREIFFAARSDMPEDKLFAVVSDDAWNSRPAATYCTTVRLTGTPGDLFLTAYKRIDQAPPDSRRYPTELSPDESAELACRQKTTFTLT